MFEVSNISFELKKRLLVNQASASFAPGSLTAIIGPNGAGKSTLIKCLAGILQPTTGYIEYNNQKITNLSPLEISHQRAYLSQHQSVAFDFTVEDIVTMGRFPYFINKPSKEDNQIILESMQLACVDHLKKRMVRTLSGGELQRVHFAKALAQTIDHTSNSNKSKILLLDEPANNLDPKHQHSVISTAKWVAQTMNVAVVVVVHDLNLAGQYADRVIAMANSKIITQGKKQDVLTEKILTELYDLPISVFSSNDQIHIVSGSSIKFESQQNKKKYESTFL